MFTSSGLLARAGEQLQAVRASGVIKQGGAVAGVASAPVGMGVDDAGQVRLFEQAQGVLDRDRLDDFFAGFLDELPHTRETLGLRLVIDQWRNGLKSGEDEPMLRKSLFEVINGGRSGN